MVRKNSNNALKEGCLISEVSRYIRNCKSEDAINICCKRIQG